MIEAKGTKEAAVNSTAERDRYTLKSGQQRLSIPLAFGALLVGIASYLKSVVPASAAPISNEEPAAAPRPEEEAPPSGAPDELHAARTTEVAPPDAFELVDSPAFDYAQMAGSSHPSQIGTVLPFRPPAALDKPAPLNPSSAGVVQFPSSKVLASEAQAGVDAIPASSSSSSSSSSSDTSSAESTAEPSRNAAQNAPAQNAPARNVPAQNAPAQKGDQKDERNRAPRVSGTTQLNDAFGSTAVLISLADLLRNATDPDGDTLSVRNLTVSSGTLTPVAEGWLYEAEAGVLGNVVVNYEVTDGEFAVAQLAHFAVVRPAPIVGTAADDHLVGTASADDIDGGEGNNSIDGGAGSDVITTASGADHIVGGTGSDVIFAGAGDDVVYAGEGNDTVHAGSGNDRIFGEAGNDLLYGEAGDDIIEGGDGDDTLLDGDGKDKVFGGTGNDHFVVALDQDDDTYDGGSEVDTLNISEATQAVVVDLEAGEASGEEIGTNTVVSFEVVIAGSGDDRLSGSSADESLFGGSGDDILLGEGGEDDLQGGDGNDQVVASLDSENDTYDGGEGTDTLDLSFATMRVEIDLTRDQASSPEIGLDTIRDFEKVIGGQGDDLFIIGQQSTIVKGGGGHNTFVFSATIASVDMPDAIHEILDFMVGDNIRIKEFELFPSEAVADDFQQQYGDDNQNDEGPIRVRHDRVADLERTYVEADMNADDQYEISIALHGNFAMTLNVHDA
jgi:Ca2+-binding RTX toxin-like protein